MTPDHELALYTRFFDLSFFVPMPAFFPSSDFDPSHRQRFFFTCTFYISDLFTGLKAFYPLPSINFRAVIVLFPSGTPNLFLFAGTVPGLASCRQSGISFSFRQKTFISDKHVVMDRRNAVRMGT